MEKFQANKKYYTPKLDGYTAKDEFDLVDRVHITNEIPPLDLYDLLHSSMKNTYWEWFVGSSYLSHDIQYNETTDGLEVIDSTGDLVQPSISKYVNGIRCKDYGPIPRMVWIPEHNEYIEDSNSFETIEGHYEPDYSETYHRYELNGVLMPEFDLLLHEGYRYLEKLYPDHPDWMKLLTLNEFNDDITQAAYLIDYNEDVNFMDWLSYYLKSKNPEEDIDEVARQESAALKIRNLKHHAFRRKFYGSKTGSRMLGNDIFQHVSVYPTAEYLPIKPFKITQNPKSVNEKWFSQINETNHDFNKTLDLSHPLLHKQFRLQDPIAKSQGFLDRYKEPSKYFGTAYSTPISAYDLYEYPNERVATSAEFTYLTMDKDFKPGQKIKINGQPSWERFEEGHISAIFPEDSVSTKVELKHIGNNLDLENSSMNLIVKENSLNHVTVDVPVSPIYTRLSIYPSNKNLLEKLIEYNNNPDLAEEDKLNLTEILSEYTRKLTQENKIFDSTKELHNILYNNQTYKDLFKLEENYSLFTLDPHQDGCLYVIPQHFLTIFNNELNATLDTSAWDNDNPYVDEALNHIEPHSILNIGPVSISDNGVIKKDDILMYDEDPYHFTSKVLDISNAFIQFQLNGPRKSIRYLENFKDEIESKENPEYCLVLNFSENNLYSNGKLCVVYGSPIVSLSTEPDNEGNINIDGTYFNIHAIPRVKPHALLNKLYENFNSICKQKFNALLTLASNNLLTRNEDNPASVYFFDASVSYSTVFNLYNVFETRLRALKREITEGTFVKGDDAWIYFADSCTNLCNSLNQRPILKKRLAYIINNFLNKYSDTLSTDFDINLFQDDVEIIQNEFNRYTNIYLNWLAEEVSILEDRTYYQSIFSLPNNSRIIEENRNIIDDIDYVLFTEMLPNKALLLNPLPNDLLMNEQIDTPSEYSLLTGQDHFTGIYHICMNDFEDLLDWEKVSEFGNTGLLNNILTTNTRAWDFGVLNTISTSETIFNNGNFVTKDILDNNGIVDLIEDHFYTDKPNTNNFIKEYDLGEGIKYVDLNNEINQLLDYKQYTRKFSYASPYFLEVFLPENKKDNICGEVETFNKLEILCTTEESSNWISFENKESINRLNFISTGDQIIGQTIENDTFIEEIDYKNNKIKVSTKMNSTGEFTLIFLCKCRFYPEDSKEDFYKYRTSLSKNKEADSYSILSHGIGTEENISNFSILGPVDIKDFRQRIKTALQEQEKYRQSFNKMVTWLYWNNIGDNKVMPSIFNTNGKSFIDVNAYTKLDDNYIFKQEILDYLDNYIEDFSGASENVNVGVAINGYTTESREVTEDKNIDSKFIITDSWFTSQPFYIKIGKGCLDGIFNVNSSDLPDIEDTEDSNEAFFYNEDFYNRSLYSRGSVDDTSISQSNLNAYYDIADPLFTVQLGEYEVSNKLLLDENSNKKITNIQFTVIKRLLNLHKEGNITICNNSFLNSDCITKFNEKYAIITGDDRNRKNFKYLGKLNSNESQTIENPKDSNFIYWYSIEENQQTQGNGLRSTVNNLESGSILLYENGTWVSRKTLFAGVYTDSSKMVELFNPKRDQNGFEYDISDIVTYNKYNPLQEGRDLRTVLLYKLLATSNNLDGASLGDGYRTLLTKYQNSPLFGNNFWFIYLGDNTTIGNSLKTAGLESGSLLGLIYYNNDFELVEIKDSIFSYSFDFSKSVLPSNNTFEYETALGLKCKCKTTPILPIEKIEKFNNTIKLNITDVVPYSYSSQIKVDLNLKAKGYKYNEDGSLSSEIQDIYLNDNLFADDKNLCIYTNYNGEKYGLYQENNKYFKNIINNIVELKKSKILNKNGLTYKDVFVPVSGFDFNGNKTSISDRIISMNKVNLRSSPTESLESNFYSSYKTYNGTLKGFVCDGENFDLNNLKFEVSYKETTQPQININKIQQLANLQKFKPFINDKLFNLSNIDFGETEFEGSIFDKQDTLNIKIKDIISDSNTTGLKYYKNLLVVKGTMNTSKMNTIIIDNKEAFNNISIGDHLIDIHPLNQVVSDYLKVTVPNYVKAIGWENNVFIIACKNKIYAINKPIKNIGELESNYTINDLQEISIGVTNFEVNSLIYDSDNQRWIVSIDNSSGQSLGTYCFEASTIGDSTVNITTPEALYLRENPQDIDEYMLTDLPLSDNEEVLENYDENENTISKKYEGGKLLTRDLAFSNLDEDAIVYIDEEFNNKRQSLYNDCASWSYPFNGSDYQLAEDSYLKVSFDLHVNAASGGSVSLYCSNDSSNFTGVQEYWVYDRKLEKWTYGVSNTFKHFLLNCNNDCKVEAYFCGTGFASYNEFKDKFFSTGSSTKANPPINEHLGEFLWKLPKPNLSDDKVLVVVVANDSTGACPSIFADLKNATIRTTNYKFSAPCQINQDTLLNSEYKLGPYQPLADTQNLPQYISNNSKGNGVVICGKDLFIKSANTVWKDNGDNNFEPSGLKTEEFFWKKASLPSMHQLTYKLFDEMDVDTAYNLVKAQQDLTIKYLKSQYPNLNASADEAPNGIDKGLFGLYRFLSRNNDNVVSADGRLEKYISDEDNTFASYKLKGVQYQMTAQGPRPDFNDGLFEKYECDEEIQSYAGVTTFVKVKSQNYLNYLRDFYEIILGCNRSEDFLKDGIYDLKVTDTDIVIITNNDDILSFPLDKATSRDELEDINNWSVVSLSPNLVAPYIDDSQFSTYSYGYNGEFSSPIKFGTKTKKLYKINSYFINKNIQIYSGYLKYDSSLLQQMRALGEEDNYKSMFPSTMAGISEHKFPFICYSTDGGKTFSDFGLKNTMMAEFTNLNEDYEANSIVKIDDSIKVYINKSNVPSKVASFSFVSNTEGDDIIQQTTTIEDISTYTDITKTNRPSKLSTVYYTVPNKESTDSFFYIEKPIIFNQFESEIISKDSNYIIFNSSVEPFATNKLLNVLISINTSNLIEEPTNYFEDSPEYFLSTGELAVKEFIEVDDYLQANRVYSPNECIPSEGPFDTNCIPCIAQDVDKNIYQYDGDDVIKMTNASNQQVYLCDEEGNYLLERNPATLPLSVQKLKVTLQNRPTYSTSFICMAKILDNYEAASYNEIMTEFFEQTLVKMSNISFNLKNPYSRFEILEYNGDLDFNNLNSKFHFYSWPKNGPNAITSFEELSSNAEFSQFIIKMNQRDGEYSSTTFNERFAPIQIGDDFYVYDKTLNLLVFEEKTFEATISLSYKSSENSTSFVNKPFSFNRDNKLEQYNEKTINTIYLKEKGYGALVDSNKWDLYLPWENDPDAFEQILLKNDLGLDVYLSDENANKIFMKNALFYLFRGEQRKISYENLAFNDNKVKVRESAYTEIPTIQYVYKLEPLQLNIYYSNDVCLNNLTLDEKLCLIKFYRGSKTVEIPNIEFKSRFYSDYTRTELVENPLVIENGFLKSNYNGTLYTDTKTLDIQVDDSIFNITLGDIKSPIILEETPCVIYNTGISNAIITYPNNSDPIEGTNSVILSKNNSAHTCVVGIKDFDDATVLLKVGETSYKVYVDIRKIKPSLLIDRDWYNSTGSFTKDTIRCKVYDGDIECTDLFNITIFDDKITATSNIDSTMVLTKEITLNDSVNTENYLTLSNYIFTKDTEECIYTSNKKLLIEGLYGEVILLKPKYNSFDALVKAKSRIIEKENIDISDRYIENVSASEITTNESSLEEGTLCRIKILPVQTIQLRSDIMNNEEYFIEVGLKDIKTFGYDRVWINQNAFLDSPFEVDGMFYNSNNLSDYSIESWKNKDGFKVYLSNISGKFVKGVDINNSLTYNVIGDENGDCSKDIYQNVDIRLCPKKCLYETTYEKFRDIYLDDKIGNNPFIGTIEINTKEDYYRIFNYKKIGGKFQKVDYEYLKVFKPYSFIIQSNEVKDFKKDDFINEKDGNVNLLVLSNIGEGEKISLCGIECESPFKNGNSFAYNSIHNFMVDSVEDLKNEDYNSTVDITEMGVFNKDGILIAYMNHPKVQYNTKKNHISYNLFVQSVN